MLKLVLIAGLLTGTFDILLAFTDSYIQFGKGPEGVLRFVASGVFSREAFTGGVDMIFLGLFFHFMIAFCFAILFYWLYERLFLLQYNVFVTGILYGIFIWVVMNLIVIPLSNTPAVSFTFFKIIKSMVILICMVGLPLSAIMKYFSKKRFV